MKKNTSFTVLIAAMMVAFMFAFNACEKQDAQTDLTGKIGFTLSADLNDTGLKSVEMDTMDYQRLFLLVSLQNSDSNLVIEKKQIPLYEFGNQFVSEKIELRNGAYILTEFMVVNQNGKVVYATPRMGSPLAYLVRRPLPLDIKILPGTETNMNVEVLAVNNQPPEKFGYLSFGVSVINPLHLFAAVYMDIPWYDPDSSDYINMARSKMVPARVEVLGPDGWGYSFDFKPAVNRVVLRGMPGTYIFKVKTKDFQQRFSFSYERLQRTSPEKPLILKVSNTPPYKELVLRTSPDSTADALITNLNSSENYGDVKSFSAFFRSEPVLTVMRLTRSLMYMDIRRHLPKSATIKKVEVTFHTLGGGGVYYPQTTSHMDTSSFFGVFRQIIEPWDEHKVTWDNQPRTTGTNSVIIDYQPWIDMNTRTYDITSLFVPVEKINLPNYGFMFQHLNEEMPGGMDFASSDVDRPLMRPEFKIYYTLP